MEVELREDLVQNCVVGDVVPVTGLVKVIAIEKEQQQGEARVGEGRRHTTLHVTLLNTDILTHLSHHGTVLMYGPAWDC